MKYKDIKDLSPAEADVKVSSLRRELFNLKLKHSLGQLQNPLQIRQIRRDIAKFLTSKNEGAKKS